MSLRALTLTVLVAAAAVSPAWAEPKFPPASAGQASPSPDDPVTLAPPAVAPDGAPDPPMPPPALSMRWASLRLAGAVLAVGFLLVGAVAGYRRLIERMGRPRRARSRMRARQGWWSFWAPDTPSEADRIHLASRRYLGPRESLGVVQVGRERFLVGITGASISLLARLGDTGRAAEAAEPEAADFAVELDEATRPRRAFLRPPTAEAGLADPATTEPRRAFLRPPTAEAGLADLATTEPGRAFLRPPTVQGDPADPVTADSAIRSRIARSRDRLARIGRVAAVGQGSRD